MKIDMIKSEADLEGLIQDLEVVEKKDIELKS